MAGNHGGHSSHPIHVHPVRQFAFIAVLLDSFKLKILPPPGPASIPILCNTLGGFNVVLCGYCSSGETTMR